MRPLTPKVVLEVRVDPSLRVAADFSGVPRDERDLIIAATNGWITNGWIIALDNLSTIQDWLSDALCRLGTGGGVSTRTLYSDDEESIFTAKRPAMLTGGCG